MNNYLTADLLNDMETRVSDLHKAFRDKFSLTETTLRNLYDSEAGIADNLGIKTLHLSFPWESYEKMSNTDWQNMVTINETNYIRYCKLVYGGDNLYVISFYNSADGIDYYLYSKWESEINNAQNYIRYKLPENIGKVTAIDESANIVGSLYWQIKVVDNYTKLLEYNKKTWQDNEIPYLQYIDNIEEGINDVAEFFIKPIGYEYKTWTTTGYCGIGTNDCGLAQKPISLNDFTRWKKNIELLEETFDLIINVWNVVSYINWNEESNFEWEDY